MSDDSGDEHLLTMLRRSFANLGATAEQAEVMAAQLLKRARQMATERGISEQASMAELLQKVVAGRRGDYTGQSPTPASGGQA